MRPVEGNAVSGTFHGCAGGTTRAQRVSSAAGAPEVRLGVPGVGVASSAIRAPFVWRVRPTRFVRLVQRV